MGIERRVGGSPGDPFPVYPELVKALAGAHVRAPLERDSTVAHVLGTCAGYAYADAEVVSTTMSRLGLADHACVHITQVVDAMFIYSTAYVLQSQCGRVVILAYRGTEPAMAGNWLGDMDVGPDSSLLPAPGGLGELRVHGGFHRNLRATWTPVLEELGVALSGKSLLDHRTPTPRPLEAIYVCGHSLGAGMATLFALKLAADARHRKIAERVRAVYTYGGPMAVLLPVPPGVDDWQRNVFRHVLPRDPVPALPASTWGPFVHLGQEFRFLDGEWQRSPEPVPQLPSMRDIPRIVLSLVQREERREATQYAMSEHGPQNYLDRLRPPGRVTEFGDDPLPG